MMIDRRKFLIDYGTAAALVGLWPSTLWAAARSDKGPLNTQRGRLSKAKFSGLLNEWFSLSDPSTLRQARVQLVAIEAFPPTPSLDQFSLRFRGRPGIQLPTGLYNVTSRARDPFQLYVEAVRGNQMRHHYRAVFALLT